MTREEYIKDLVSQNLTGEEIVRLASQFGEEEEEVKTEVVADQAGAAVTTTTQEASESLDGTSLSEEEKTRSAAEAKEKKDRINSLYTKYNEEQEDNLTVEEKSEWLKSNVNIPTDEDIDKINKESSLLDNYFSGFGFYESEEEKALAVKEDKDLQIFTYNQKNKDYIESVKDLSKNNSLTSEQKQEKFNSLEPPSLVIDKEVEDIIIDQEQEWRTNAVKWSTMDPEDVKKRFTLENGAFDEKKYNDYKKFMDVDDEISDLKTKINGYVNKEGNVYGSMRSKYESALTKVNELSKKRSELIEPYNKIKDTQADKITNEYLGGMIGGDRIKYRTEQTVDPGALELANTFLPKDFSSIENKEDLDKTMKQAYSKFVKNDTILSSTWEAIQQGAKTKIEAYQNEIQKTADLTTPEGVADANAKIQAYAKKITLDEFENSKEYKTRMTQLGTVMDRAMSNTSKAYGRSQDGFLNFTDLLRGGNTGINGSDGLPFNNTLANLIESVGKGGVNLYGSAKKAIASVEAKGVRNVQRKIDIIDERVENGEITKEEGERLKNQSSKTDADGVRRGAGATFSTKSLMEELMSDKKDVEKLFDSIEDTEAYTGLFNSSDLSDGISFQEAIFTTGEALPQIGLATVGTLTGNPILAGLGTAAMFTQMYGDNYWSAYQEGIKKDAEAMGINLGDMSAEERREFEINALNEGKHANMATSAAFAAVMTYAEKLGANKILKKTEEALGLGAGGLVSFYKGSWKESGEALLKGALRKVEAGGTEFATEFAQEVLGQLSTGLQSGNSATEYIDWSASLEAGKAGGVVGVMIPFASSVATQSAVEIRNISRDVAIKFAPNSEYGKLSLEAEKYFEGAQTNLDNQLEDLSLIHI